VSPLQKRIIDRRVEPGPSASEGLAQNLLLTRKPRRGITGALTIGRSTWGDVIAPDKKHHRSLHVEMWIGTPPRDYAAAIGSIRLGSLFLTLPTRVLTGQEIMSSEG
jgi:hypothetical protein